MAGRKHPLVADQTPVVLQGLQESAARYGVHSELPGQEPAAAPVHRLDNPRSFPSYLGTNAAEPIASCEQHACIISGRLAPVI
jgi:hypothetical protein